MTSDQVEADEAMQQEALAARRRLGIMRGLLFLYLLLLGWMILWNPSWSPLELTGGTSNFVVQAANQLASFTVRMFVLFFPLAFLCAACCFLPSATYSWGDVLLATLLGFIISLLLAIGAKTMMDGSLAQLPSIFVVGLITFICLIGSWGGATWERSRWIGGWICFQLFTYSVLIAAASFSLLWLGLESQPLAIEATPISSEDRVRLVRLARENDPRDIPPGETSRLVLTEPDINKLFTWGLSVLPGEQIASVRVVPSQVSLSMTGEFPFIPTGSVLNIVAAGSPTTKQGELGFVPRQLRVGKVRVPEWLLDLCGPLIIDEEWHDERTRPLFSALQGIQVDDGTVTVAYRRLELPKGFVSEAMAGINWGDEIAPAVRAHTEELLRLAEQHESLTFARCIQTVFALAEKRSATSDPILENRAAILALGYTLGHPKIKQLIGPDLPSLSITTIRKFRRVTLRDRNDWTRHYTLSAAIEALSNELASHALGVLKEELDADGGSGFSFGDLLADRAGTMLAVSTTRSARSARIMQQRLAAGVSQDDLMPPGSDLPEGLDREEFVRHYGGVDQPRYNQLVAEIDRRIIACPAYQGLP